MKTTLNELRANFLCTHDWYKLMRFLGKTQPDDEELSILDILDANGLSDALHCLRIIKGEDRVIRLYAVWCARQMQHLCDNPILKFAVNAAELYANGVISEMELLEANSGADCLLINSRISSPVNDAAYTAFAASATRRGVNMAAISAAVAPIAGIRFKVEVELRRVLNCVDSGIDPYPVKVDNDPILSKMEITENRLFDLLKNDDPQAHKEGRKHLEQIRPDLAAKL